MHNSLFRSAPAIALILLLAVHAGVAAEDASDPSKLTLGEDLRRRGVRGRVLRPGSLVGGRLGLHHSRGIGEIEEAKEIVRYDPATGERTMLVPVTSLVPAEGEEPLAIDDYLWSEDGRRLLIFTNTKKVWRRNTRGDYWLLDIGSSKLQQLGGEAEESSMMFAKLSPDGTKVAWVDFGRKGSLRPGSRRPLGHPADQRRRRAHHQRHLGLGLRGGVRPPRRISLEPRRPSHRLLAV